MSKVITSLKAVSRSLVISREIITATISWLRTIIQNDKALFLNFGCSPKSEMKLVGHQIKCCKGK